MKTKLLTICLLLVTSQVFAEEWANIYTNSGDKLQIALPDGYCDITQTNEGKFILNHLNKTKRNLSIYKNFEAKIVYNLCGKKYDYPWGYIFFNNQKYSSSYTQTDLNKLESSSFNKTYINEIKEKTNKSHDINNQDIKIESVDRPELVWEDKNALIFYTNIQANIEGQKFIEEVTGSTILFNGYQFSMYIYDKKGAQNSLHNSQLLLNAAKSTKSR